MNINLWKKGLVLGIIILFVGASILPSISGNVKNKKISIDTSKETDYELLKQINREMIFILINEYSKKR